MSKTQTTLTRINALIETGKSHLKAYTHKANVIQAQKCFSFAYILCSKNLGKDDVTNIEILSLLAAAHNYHIGLDYSSKDVIALLEEMKRIQFLNYDEAHLDLVETYKRLATSYAKSKKYEPALDNYFQALDIQTKPFYKDDLNTAHTLERIGDVYNNLVNTKKAKEFYIKALDMVKLAGGDTDVYTGPEINILNQKISRVTPIIPNILMSKPLEVSALDLSANLYVNYN